MQLVLCLYSVYVERNTFIVLLDHVCKEHIEQGSVELNMVIFVLKDALSHSYSS